MSQIRRDSLKATTWIYVGFLVGALNTYLFTHKGWFAPNEYGLTRSLLDISILISAIATFGTSSFLYKFFPYYQNNLPKEKNDILVFAMRIGIIGFLITGTALVLARPLIIQKFSTNASLLVEYFYCVLPLAGSVMLYTILEAYSYGFGKGVLTSLLRELVIRLSVLIFIVLKIFHIISLNQFVICFSLQYLVIVIVLLFILNRDGQLWISLKSSRVTKKFRKKIYTMMAFTSVVLIVSVLRQAIDSLVLASKVDLATVGIFGFAAYLVSLLQAPLRSIVAVTIPILSISWKNKNIKEIQKIYYRTSINLLCFSLFMFFCIWLNYADAILFFKMNLSYLDGKWVFFVLGIVTIIEMGTGVSGQIIATSTYWRFEMLTSLLLTILILPLSYYFTVKYGILGPALANLVSFTIYNLVRMEFLFRKFRLQPFNRKTLEILIFSVVSYAVVQTLHYLLSGILYMFSSTILFAFLFIGFIYYRNISPDTKPIISALLKRFTQKK